MKFLLSDARNYIIWYCDIIFRLNVKLENGLNRKIFERKINTRMHPKNFYSIIICALLLASCSPVQSVESGQLNQNSTQTASSPKPTAANTAEKPLPTSTLASIPTPTPALTETGPVLNGTPMPAVLDVIKKENALDLKVLKRSSSNKQIELLGVDGSRWFLQNENAGEIHDTKTNELIWKGKDSPSSLVDPSGDQIFFYKNDFREMEIQYPDKASETFSMPPMPKGDFQPVFFPVIQKRLMVVEAWPAINVFPFGASKPKYSVNGGGHARVSTGGKYLLYLQDISLQIIDIESGKKVTDFTLGNGDLVITFWYGKEIWKTSWDDEYLALSRNGGLDIWRLSDHKLIRTIPLQKESTLEQTRFSFSKNNKAILILLAGGTLQTWSLDSGNLVHEEKLNENSFDQLRVSDDGEIIKFNLPEVPGKAWNSNFNEGSSLTFAKNGDSLFFANQIYNAYQGTTETCVWDLSSSPSCDFRVDQISQQPAYFQLLALGNDNERYFLRSLVKPITLNQGWEKDGTFIAQIPSVSTKGVVSDFKYDPAIGVVLVKYSDGKTFIFNHKTNTRLLLEGNNDRIFISKDGMTLFELVNQKKNPAMLEFVQYDSKTLKEISRTAIEKTIHPSVVDKTVDDLSPQLSGVTLSPDGKFLYACIQYISVKKPEGDYKPNFLTIPLDDAAKSSLVELNIPSSQTSNMVITENGDLTGIAQTQTGDLHFIETATGKIIKTIHVGGSPIKLALKPDGKLLAVADTENGIQLIGIPGN